MLAAKVLACIPTEFAQNIGFVKLNDLAFTRRFQRKFALSTPNCSFNVAFHGSVFVFMVISQLQRPKLSYLRFFSNGAIHISHLLPDIDPNTLHTIYAYSVRRV